MRKRDVVELASVALAAAALAPLFPSRLAAGTLALIASALLLGQGLLRDLWLKFGAAARASAPASGTAAFCMESGIGLAGIVAGTALLALGAGGQVSLARTHWALVVLGVGIVGFALKDVVVDLRGRRLRIQKDHRSVVLW